jgi:hypothetical protein
VVRVSLKNVSFQEQDLSSLLQFPLKDSTCQKYDETVTSFASQPPGGKVTAGDSSKGDIVYEVPKNQSTFTLAFEADITSSGQTVWDPNDWSAHFESAHQSL